VSPKICFVWVSWEFKFFSLLMGQKFKSNTSLSLSLSLSLLGTLLLCQYYPSGNFLGSNISCFPWV
ncbi:MAG: hypothetical protein N7Q72_05755, partial [Spiroplasma sp. Tabriz.8]|nr:hypothetical protein [Spiroplasma sp. Tabriz.8]